jgi:hypothetical protein
MDDLATEMGCLSSRVAPKRFEAAQITAGWVGPTLNYGTTTFNQPTVRLQLADPKDFNQTINNLSIGRS